MNTKEAPREGLTYPCSMLIMLMFAAYNPQNLRLIVRILLYLQSNTEDMYINQTENWPHFSWNKDATKNYDSPLSDDRLFGWHNCLFPTGRSGMEIINVGRFRIDPMKVISGTIEREKVHYRAPEADAVPSEMQKLLEWFNSDSTPKDYIKSAVAHFWFVSIHPFDDGNGRISRAIADMALSQADDSPLRFFSISRQTNKEKTKYNDILESCQKGTCDISSWVEWYLDCMLRAIENADEMLSSILDKAFFWQTHSQIVITDRQKNILNLYLDGHCEKLNVKNWAKKAVVSGDTAGRDVRDLVDKGIL
ncbi:MAG: Fic family protein, partial [Bacteroidales bacterium]